MKRQVLLLASPTNNTDRVDEKIMHNNKILLSAGDTDDSSDHSLKGYSYSKSEEKWV